MRPRWGSEGASGPQGVVLPGRVVGPVVDVPLPDTDTRPAYGGDSFGDSLDWGALAADPWGIYIDPRQTRSDTGVCHSVSEMADVSFGRASEALEAARETGIAQNVRTCPKDVARETVKALKASPHHVRCRALPIEAPRDVV